MSTGASRVRVRPTREETRQRLLAAAAGVFAEHGVGAATVEQVTSAAGLTRGAFYSNFSTMEELAAAMLDDHLARSWAHNHTLAARHPDPANLVRALRQDTTRRDDPLHQNPLLQVELMLLAAGGRILPMCGNSCSRSAVVGSSSRACTASVWVRQAPTGSSSTDGPAGSVTPAAPWRKAGNHSTRWRTTSRATQP